MAAGRVDEIARWEEHLDRAVEEVFSTMVGVSCARSESAPGDGERFSAVIGLAGALSGSLVLRTGRSDAGRIAERMTGAAAEPAIVRDAVGEICNMVAGAWKGRDPKLSSGCLLSTPTVVEGDKYELFSQRARVRIERTYQCEEMNLSLTLFCDPPF